MSAVTKVLTTIAYSTTDKAARDRDQLAKIEIPEGYKYVDHYLRKTTEAGRFNIGPVYLSYHPTLKGRVSAVQASVYAIDQLFSRSWIGVELSVTIEKC